MLGSPTEFLDSENGNLYIPPLPREIVGWGVCLKILKPGVKFSALCFR
jgi:hypothetical protein